MPRAVPSEGRLRDRAAVLTVTAFGLLVPPIVTIFDMPYFILGVPVLHVYCFGVWLAAIAAGFALSRRMATSDDDPAEAESGRREPGT